MAADVNRVTLTCRLTREPELRMTQSGMAVMNLGVAFNDRRKNAQTGEWEDVGNFADCVMFGTRAQSLANYLRKGSRVAIDGKLRWSSWEARDGGGKRSKLEILVDEIVLLDPRQQDGPQGPQGGARGGYQPQAGGYGPQAQGAPQGAPQGGYQQWSQQQYDQQQPAQATIAQQPELTPSVYDEDIPFGG